MTTYPKQNHPIKYRPSQNNGATSATRDRVTPPKSKPRDRQIAAAHGKNGLGGNFVGYGDDEDRYSTQQHHKKKNTLLRVIPTMTCRVVVVRWGLSGWIGSVICATWITLRIIPTRAKEPWRNPSHLFSGILRALVVSCPPFSIAPGTSVCESKAQTCRRRNMPNHVRTPPGKHISINRHQTWQYTSWSKVKS